MARMPPASLAPARFRQTGVTFVEVVVCACVLSITAENTLETFRDYTLVLHELPEVRYRAAFDLPEHVDTAGIKAANKNGLLILTLPKREEVKPRRIAIAAG